jgi:hypothetical protein
MQRSTFTVICSLGTGTTETQCEHESLTATEDSLPGVVGEPADGRGLIRIQLEKPEAKS